VADRTALLNGFGLRIRVGGAAGLPQVLFFLDRALLPLERRELAEFGGRFREVAVGDIEL